MLKRNAKFIFLFSIITSLFLAACSGNDDNASAEGGKTKKIEFTAGHTLTPDSARHKAMEKFKEALEEKSDGTMTLKLFPQSQLGGEVEMQEAAQSGNQDIVFTSSSTLVNLAPEFSVLDLPYIFNDMDHANKALRSDAGTQLLDLLPDHQLVGLGYLEAVERNIFSNKPIKKAADIKGMKNRVIQSPVYVKTYKALGSQPTPMAYSELYTALQQGVVDGGDASADQFVLDKFVEVSDYYNITKMNYIPMVGIMSKSVWDGLTEEQQEIVQSSFDVASEFAPEEFERQVNSFLEEMKEKGIEVIEPDIDSFKEATEQVKTKILKDIPSGNDLYEAFQNVE
ncbi:TRAP transporter substrate-binding protein [Sporosarcina sp. P33]|uniref:TRAP transporter substrate-binding protein n=1 Tax=Sporosarcina sp. P33 TaxID=1930764 RepID=UPI0009C0DB11|nr:TRAP transporter substrate-binding protein [Sporosarcina sp. P33]ARD49057.1 hypothetical protein SporoP33_12965 [Sporosarcina sp. P33]